MKKGHCTLSQINKVFIDFKNHFEQTFAAFNYKKILFDFTNKLHSDELSSKNDMLNYFTKILDEMITIKSVLLISITTVQSKIRSLDIQFVSKINELSLTLKNFVTNARDFNKNIIHQFQNVLPNISLPIKEIDKELISYYDNCRGLFSQIKSIHLTGDEKKELKRVKSVETAFSVKKGKTINNFFVSDKKSNCHYEPIETTVSECNKRIETSPNASKIASRLRNKTPNISTNNMMNTSTGSSSTISNISINIGNITLLSICENVREFINDMKNLQDSIVQKKKNVTELKKNFERKKKKLFLLSSAIIQNTSSNENSSNKNESNDQLIGLTQKLRTLNKQINSLSHENDSLKQSNEILSAQVNEMKNHIKNLSNSQQEGEKAQKIIVNLSKKIAIIKEKLQSSITNPISLASSPKTNLYDNEILTGEKTKININELIKASESEYNEILFLISSKVNDAQKNKSSFQEISNNLNEIIKFLSKDKEDEENEINVINGTNNNPINLLEDSIRTLSRKSSTSNCVNVMVNSTNNLNSSHNTATLRNFDIYLTILSQIETIRKKIGMQKVKDNSYTNSNEKLKNPKNGKSKTEADSKEGTVKIVPLLNEGIVNEEFISNGLDGGELTFDNALQI